MCQNKPSIKFQLGHSEFIRCIDWSPDGKYIVTGGTDATIILWEAYSGRIVRRFQENTRAVNSISWSFDGRYFASGSFDGTVMVWDPLMDKPIRTFYPASPVSSVKWSPKENIIACGLKNNVVKLLQFTPHDQSLRFQPAEEKFTFQGHQKEVIGVDWNVDGQRVASASKDGTIIVWNARNGSKVLTIDKHPGTTVSFIWTNDGKYLATSQPSGWEKGDGKTLVSSVLGKKIPGYVNIYDAVSGVQVKKIATRLAAMSLTGNPDGKLIAVREFEFSGTSEVLNILTGKLTEIFSGEDLGIGVGAAWSPTDPFLVVGGPNGLIRIFNHRTRSEVASALDLAPIEHVSWSPKGEFISYSNYMSTKLWKVHSIRMVQDFEWLKGVSWGKNDNFFAGYISQVQDSVQKLSLFKRIDDNFYPVWRRGFTNITAMEMSPSGKLIAVAYRPSGVTSIAIVMAESGLTLTNWSTKGYAITALTWNPYDSRIVTATSTETMLNSAPEGKYQVDAPKDRNIIVVWKAPSGEQDKVLQRGLDQGTTTILFRKEGGTEITQEGQGHQKEITDLSWSPDGKYILSAGEDGKIKAWDYEKGNWFRDFSHSVGSVKSVDWSPDGMSFLSGGSDQTVCIWTLESDVQKKTNFGTVTLGHATLSEHNGVVNSIAWGTKGKFVSGGSDRIVKIWDQDKPVLNLVGIRGSNEYMAYTPDGFYSSSYKGNGVVHYEMNNKLYRFDQFDVLFNRPDVIEARLNPDRVDLIKLYEAAYRKRLEKMGFDAETANSFQGLNFERRFATPTLQLINQPGYSDASQKTFRLKCKVDDKQHGLQRLNAWINGVSIYGRAGYDLTSVDKNISKEIEITVQLSNGSNILEVAVQNRLGVESLKERVSIEYKGIAPQKPKLYFVGMGVNRYQFANQKFPNLKYPVKDVRDVMNALVKNSTQFGKIDSTILTNEQLTRESFGLIREKLSKSTVDDIVVLFFNGHGIVSRDQGYFLCTPKVNPLNPEVGGIRYDDFESLLENIPARRKLILIDACYSGEIDSQPTDFELMKDLFRDFRRETGAWIISSSGMTQSLEGWSDGEKKIQNGVFSYAIINAFRSLGGTTSRIEKDKKELQVSELKEYVIREVIRITEGVQKPTVRRENPEFNFSF